MPNMINQLPRYRDKTHFEQTFPVQLNILHFDNSLSNRPGKLKEVIQTYMQSMNDKEILICKKGILDMHLHLTKISFLTKL